MKFFYYSFLFLNQNVKQEKIGISTITTIPTRSVFFHLNSMELNITNALITAGPTQTTMKQHFGVQQKSMRITSTCMEKGISGNVIQPARNQVSSFRVVIRLKIFQIKIHNLKIKIIIISNFMQDLQTNRIQQATKHSDQNLTQPNILIRVQVIPMVSILCSIFRI